MNEAIVGGVIGGLASLVIFYGTIALTRLVGIICRWIWPAPPSRLKVSSISCFDDVIGNERIPPR